MGKIEVRIPTPRAIPACRQAGALGVNFLVLNDAREKFLPLGVSRLGVNFLVLNDAREKFLPLGVSRLGVNFFFYK